MKKLVFMILALGLVITRPVAAAETNILLITVDTLRPDHLSCYDPKYVRTAQIDALAARGVLFDQAFAHTPMTLPSHTNILLGLTPQVHGVSENGRSIVSQNFTTLAEFLKTKNFSTGAFIGAFPLDSRFGLDQGFDVYDDAYSSQPEIGQNYSERIAEKTVGAARAWISKQTGKWFCWVHVWDPHAPYRPPEPFAKKFASDLYSGEVAYVDQELGKLFDDGKKNGWADRTVIVLTGDHGESLGEHGEATHSYFAYNATLHIPLIIAGPGLNPARIREAVSHIDLFPTICDLLGLAPPSGLMGESLKPLFSGKTINPRPLYIEALEAYLNRGWAPLYGFIENGKKYIDLPIPELYDLTKDFNETHNLAAGTDLSAFRKRMEDIRKTAGPGPSESARYVDAETREKLRSLGYIISPVTKTKPKYGPEDDLKTLAPLDQKLMQAQIFGLENKTAQCVKLYEEIIKARPDFAAAYDQLFQIYKKQNILDEGLAVLDRGYKANPENYVFAAAYGIALVRAGKLDKGTAVLENAVGFYDKDAEVWNCLGAASLNKGNPAKALPFFQKALESAPGDALINDNIGSAYTMIAQRSKSSDDLRRALESYQTALAADPALASAHNGLGGVRMLMGQIDEAIKSYEKALALNPNFDLATYNVGLAYLSKGDKTAALKNFRRYLNLKARTITEAERGEINKLIEECQK